MKATYRKYNPERDFLRVRDLLVQTYPLFGTLSNWRLERRNYARYFVSPMLGDPNPAQSVENIRLWEKSIGIWESEGDGAVADGIVGVVHSEYADPNIEKLLGEAWFQRRPGYDFLLDEMLDYAEETFMYANKLRFAISDQDTALQAVAQKRGYEKNVEWAGDDSVFTITDDLPEPKLPEGFTLQSMADDNNLAFRAKAFGLGFNHPDPKDWPSVATYAELQKAPDYRKDLDLSVVSPNGDYVSFCNVWYDAKNKVGILEPVGTHPDYRLRGLGRAVITEGIRRAAALGATEVCVGSGMDFYLKIGFEKKFRSYTWQKTFA